MYSHSKRYFSFREIVHETWCTDTNSLLGLLSLILTPLKFRFSAQVIFSDQDQGIGNPPLPFLSLMRTGCGSPWALCLSFSMLIQYAYISFLSRSYDVNETGFSFTYYLYLLGKSPLGVVCCPSLPCAEYVCLFFGSSYICLEYSCAPLTNIYLSARSLKYQPTPCT